MLNDHSPKNSSTIDTDMVKHVAALARLGIQEDEAEAFSHQFSEIIEYFNLLNEVDTQDVRPASETSTTRTVMRADLVQPSMSRADFLKNVPHTDGNYVQVPLIFGEE
jgi:aspartyl-tRNA(Asn)/glutamyl-tRNA(Gln) amidotransferase subunit C